jgi:pheromone shutdown-related protein TraB
MITLIGTGHVFKLSNQLLNIFDKINPNALCVELDSQRYQALLLKQTDPEKYKESAKKLPYFYRILSQFQENMAERYGVKPGDEMMTTINYAHAHQIPLVCIDMHAQSMFSTMLKTMPITEKMKFFLSGLGSIFVRKDNIDQQVKNITNDVDSYLSIIGDKFPTIKKILIDERNKYMAQNIIKLQDTYEHIIAVMGDGHIPGIKTILKENNIDPEIIRLKELQKYKINDSDQATASFHVEYQQF